LWSAFCFGRIGAFVAPKRRLAPSNKAQQSDLCVTFAIANSGEYFRTKTKILSVIPLHSKSVFADPCGLLFVLEPTLRNCAVPKRRKALGLPLQNCTCCFAPKRSNAA